jgi:disulfide oxidoreductase YuzD
MKIKILGTGCPNCQKLQKNVEQAILEIQSTNISVENVETFDKIMDLELYPPTLVIDEKIISSGRHTVIEEIKNG